METEVIPRTALEYAIRDRDAKLVVRCVAEGERLTRIGFAGELADASFSPAVVFTVLELALSRRQLEKLALGGGQLADMAREVLAPPPESADAEEWEIIRAIVEGDSGHVLAMTGKKRGILRNWAPELALLIPDLSKPAVAALLEKGFADRVRPRVLKTFIDEVKTPDVLANLSYRERLMYANLAIHIMQGETIYPDEDWYPMGNALVEGCDRGVYCHPYGYYYDPSHRYEPRFADDEYETPAHDIGKSRV